MTATPQPNGSTGTAATADGAAPSKPDGGGQTGRHAAEPGLGQLISEATGSLQTIVHSELELAKLELRSSVKNAGAGVGFFGAAVVLLVFSLTFGLIALAEGLTTIGIWRWLSYLIVFGFLVLLVAMLVVLGIRQVKRVRAPERTIATSKDTVAYLKATATSHPKQG